MTVAGVRTARPHGRSGVRSTRPVVVARVTLAATRFPEPEVIESRVLASRRDLHVARRLRRRDALLGVGVLAATLGATVGVLVIH